MVKIRLARQGSGNNKFYRVVAIDEQSKRSGKVLDYVGYWQPSKKIIELDSKKIKEWVIKGAIVTSAVDKLIKSK